MTQFCVEEAVLEYIEGEELLAELRALKEQEPAFSPGVKSQMDSFRSWQS